MKSPLLAKLDDPEFLSLSRDDQDAVLGTFDSEYRALPPEDRQLIYYEFITPRVIKSKGAGGVASPDTEAVSGGTGVGASLGRAASGVGSLLQAINPGVAIYDKLKGNPSRLGQLVEGVGDTTQRHAERALGHYEEGTRGRGGLAGLGGMLAESAAAVPFSPVAPALDAADRAVRGDVSGAATDAGLMVGGALMGHPAGRALAGRGAGAVRAAGGRAAAAGTRRVMQSGPVQTAARGANAMAPRLVAKPFRSGGTGKGGAVTSSDIEPLLRESSLRGSLAGTLVPQADELAATLRRQLKEAAAVPGGGLSASAGTARRLRELNRLRKILREAAESGTDTDTVADIAKAALPTSVTALAHLPAGIAMGLGSAAGVAARTLPGRLALARAMRRFAERAGVAQTADQFSAAEVLKAANAKWKKTPKPPQGRANKAMTAIEQELERSPAPAPRPARTDLDRIAAETIEKEPLDPLPPPTVEDKFARHAALLGPTGATPQNPALILQAIRDLQGSTVAGRFSGTRARGGVPPVKIPAPSTAMEDAMSATRQAPGVPPVEVPLPSTGMETKLSAVRRKLDLARMTRGLEPRVGAGTRTVAPDPDAALVPGTAPDFASRMKGILARRKTSGAAKTVNYEVTKVRTHLSNQLDQAKELLSSTDPNDLQFIDEGRAAVESNLRNLLKRYPEARQRLYQQGLDGEPSIAEMLAEWPGRPITID